MAMRSEGGKNGGMLKSNDRLVAPHGSGQGLEAECVPRLPKEEINQAPRTRRSTAPAERSANMTTWDGSGITVTLTLS